MTAVILPWASVTDTWTGPYEVLITLPVYVPEAPPFEGLCPVGAGDDDAPGVPEDGGDAAMPGAGFWCGLSDSSRITPATVDTVVTAALRTV
ncbi:hypothetical protein GCM10009575_001460 [Streptomyces rhizosphaericus]|uniref:Uncharacterized protein n=1 Tax=Streptomyces rhizosphaericus TaxID=114699 RepID=A0ABP3Z483_9ACTN